MRYNSTLIFMAGGIALGLLLPSKITALRKNIARVLCGFIGLMGFISLVQHHFGLNLGIDHFFFSRTDQFPEGAATSWAKFTGRFSPIGGWLSLMMANSLLLLDYETKSGKRPGQVFSLLLGMVGAISFLAYFFGVKVFFNLSLYTRLALPATIALILFSMGCFFARPTTGLAAVLISPYSGGALARRLIPSVSLSVAVIGWLSWMGIQAGFYNEPYGFAIFLVATLVMILFLVWRNATTLDQLDQKRTQAEGTVRQTKDRLALAMDAASMGYWDWDIRTNIVQISPLWAEIMGADTQGSATTFSYFINKVVPEDRQTVKECIRKSHTESKEYICEFRIEKRKDCIRWIHGRGRILYDNSNNAVRMTGVIVDITDRKRNEEYLKMAVQRANEANQLKSAFLANMSHEIRTPLGAVLGFSDLLMDPTLSTEEKCGFFDAIQRNGRQLSNLINDILDLSKVEAGQLQVESMAIDLRETIQDVLSTLNPKAQKKEISLRSSSADPLPAKIVTDPVRLKQILTNVLGNAIKFTERGSVDLFVCQESDDLIRFTIKDSGIGIDKEQIKNLFHPFSQADSSTTRKFGGTGLGLALSKKLSQNLGGDLVLKSSQPGIGSIFELTIKDFR